MPGTALVLEAGTNRNYQPTRKLSFNRKRTQGMDEYQFGSAETATSTVGIALAIADTSPNSLVARNARIAAVAGLCNDDPGWDDFLQAMEDYRREQDALDIQSLAE